jgi:hypothetical protein
MRATQGIRLPVLGIVLALAGCAVTSQDGQRMGIRSDPYAAYVRDVYRQQSEVSDTLIIALDEADPDSARYAELDAADLAVLTACRGINELASAEQSGDSPRGLAALKRARQVPECERAVQDAVVVLGGQSPF